MKATIASGWKTAAWQHSIDRRSSDILLFPRSHKARWIGRRFAPTLTHVTRRASVISADEPLWLTLDDIAAIHQDQIDRHGGLAGWKDRGLVESAVHAPRQLHHYLGVSDVLVLAIRLCFSIVKNHGFVDGNKRTAAFAMIEFLAINGYDLFVPDDDEDVPLLGLWIERLAGNDYDEARLYDRLEHFLQPI